MTTESVTYEIHITDPTPPITTVDNLIARLPLATQLALANDFYEPLEKRWSLEITPSESFYERRGNRWPWSAGKTYYGPTAQSVIDQADEDMRKLKL